MCIGQDAGLLSITGFVLAIKPTYRRSGLVELCLQVLGLITSSYICNTSDSLPETLPFAWPSPLTDPDVRLA
jgi:hypothetical protein